MDQNTLALSLHFSPLLPNGWLALALALGLGVLALALALWKNKNALLLRVLTLCAFALLLLNPSLLEENRESVRDVAVIMVDQSPSQKMGKREDRTASALAALVESLKKYKNLDVRIVHAPEDTAISRETKLFDALDKTLADVPLGQRAGVIFLTDGQIHDVPDHADLFTQYGPVHALLSGERHEKDRRLVILEAPSFGIVGQNVTLKYKIEDTGVSPKDAQNTATLTIDNHIDPPQVVFVPVGAEQTLNIPVKHAGQNVVELHVKALPGEMTQINNKTALLLNGVRDRLRVLLVSGKPHAGGRTWRDLLTSDPGVDLVHFTILREPEKLDSTPQNELALIAFPFRELFELKLYDFDLIIFDRYRLNHILPSNYFENIAHYVEKGGAFLEASGPSFAGEDSIYNTALMNILPGAPTGNILRKPYKPAITETGLYHPVTRDLTGSMGLGSWGSWLRQVEINKKSGETLMSGIDGRPLLILDRVQKGRVAQIASDHVWLWSRGYDGGGPHAELLRRVVHWLMKEPELDEKALNLHVHGDQITIRSQDSTQDQIEIEMERPDGTLEKILLNKDKRGVLETVLQANQPGIYSFGRGEEKRFAIIGTLNAPELEDVKTTPERLEPLIKASGGGALWLSETPEPQTRYLRASHHYAGKNWIGLKENKAFIVKGVQDRPIFPAWFSALFLLLMVVLTWWREGRSGS